MYCSMFQHINLFVFNNFKTKVYIFVYRYDRILYTGLHLSINWLNFLLCMSIPYINTNLPLFTLTNVYLSLSPLF